MSVIFRIHYFLPMHNYSALLLLLLFFAGCDLTPTAQVPDLSPTLQFADQLEADYDRFRFPGIQTRRFALEDIQPEIDALGTGFTVSEAGRSIEGRLINRIQWGSGPVQVLLWSQMHGDEPTATTALLDIFRWLEGSGNDPKQDSIRTLLSEKLTLTFLPMLNPDGAARYTRRNAIGIDLNRDALRLQSPEARILKNERDRLQANWGFNLHDQSPYYGVDFPPIANATISVLAPAYDWEKNMNAQREDATQVIALMNRIWQRTTPNGVGRYNDDFEPRAFGDNLQKWGTRTILIESGGLAQDREKQIIRRMNFVGILTALHGIATGTFEAVRPEQYWAIPENSSNAYHDLIIRNVTVNLPAGDFLLDVAFRQNERAVTSPSHTFFLDGSISEVGDLHTFRGHQELDGTGLVAKVGEVYPQVMDASQLGTLNYKQLYLNGYTAVRVRNYRPAMSLVFKAEPEVIGEQSGAKVVRLLPEKYSPGNEIIPGQATDLLLYRNGKLETVVINGEARSPNVPSSSQR